MKLIRYNGGRIGVVKGDQVHDVSAVVAAGENFWPPIEMNRLIRDFDALRVRIDANAAAARPMPLASVHLETPIPWPNKLMAYPVNYHDHAKEMSDLAPVVRTP